MAEYNAIPRAGTAPRSAAFDEGLRTYMNKVYSLMGIGMLVTAGTAWGLSTLAIGPDGTATALGQAIYYSPLKWVIMFLPLVMVFAFGALINRISAAGAQLFFYVYAALMGLSLSSTAIVLATRLRLPAYDLGDRDVHDRPEASAR